MGTQAPLPRHRLATPGCCRLLPLACALPLCPRPHKERPLDITGNYRFNASREAVWSALLDAEALRASIPGCQRLERTGLLYDLALAVGVSAVRGTYSGSVTVVRPEPPDSLDLRIVGRGDGSTFEASARITLGSASSGTLLSYSGGFSAQGTLARVGAQSLTGAARLLLGQFFRGLDRHIESRLA